MKIKDRSRKRSHKRDGIGVGRIRTFPVLPTSLPTTSLAFRLWSSENQMVGVGGRSGSGRINQWKCTFPRFVIGLVLHLLLPILTIWFSLDHNWNVSDGVVSGIGTLFSLDHKVYASHYDSDSDSVASENQPLVAHTVARCVWLVVKGVTWGANQSQSRIKPNVTKMDQSPATIPAV